MDPEQTFLRVHARLSGVLARLLTPRFRTTLEYLCLFNALVLLTLLVNMHVNFVGQPGCVKEFSKPGITEAQLIRIKITDSWNRVADKTLSSRSLLSHQPGQFQAQDLPAKGRVENLQMTQADQKWWHRLVARFWFILNGSRGGKTVENVRTKNDLRPLVKLVDEGLAYIPLGKRTASEDGFPPDVGEPIRGSKISFRAGFLQYVGRWSTYGAAYFKSSSQSIRSFWQILKTAGWGSATSTPKDEHRVAAWNKLHYLNVDRRERNIQLLDPTYLYSIEKGFLILSEDAKARHNVQIVNISISAQNECFGNRWQQFLIDNFVGYDTVLMNSLLDVLGKGYMYNFQSKELYSLNYLQESRGVIVGFEDYIVFKFGVLIMSLFVFFTTTMSVSFTLRETQARMLKFTVQLQHHARHRLPTYRLIFFHVFESLVFVPIMIGILFFLFEFFDDQLLAFMVLTLVWLCELFTMISVRTSISTLYFPRFFFLYFMVFHVYFFSYPYGFSYLAFSATAAFMQHLILYFWNRFEIPALQHFLRRRALLQQQGLQITSSAILTSTLQVARVNQGGVVIMGGTSTLAQPENIAPMPGAASTTMDGSAASQAQGGTANESSSPRNSPPSNADDRNSADYLNARLINEENNSIGGIWVHGLENQSRQNNIPRNLGVEHQPGIVDLRNNPSEAADQMPHTNAHMTAGIATARIQPQSFAMSSLLPWILGSSSTTLFSLFPVSRDPNGIDPSSSSHISPEERINTGGSGWSGASNEGTGLRQRHGLVAEESENR